MGRRRTGQRGRLVIPTPGHIPYDVPTPQALRASPILARIEAAPRALIPPQAHPAAGLRLRRHSNRWGRSRPPRALLLLLDWRASGWELIVEAARPPGCAPAVAPYRLRPMRLAPQQSGRPPPASTPRPSRCNHPGQAHPPHAHTRSSAAGRQRASPQPSPPSCRCACHKTSRCWP
jgi:hypothetical protein